MLPHILLSALFATAALSAAVPASLSTTTPFTIAPLDLDAAYALAESLGVDPTGPIPSDAVAFPGGYTFEADSPAALWTRLQLAPRSASLAPRQSASIGIGMWTGQNCNGSGMWVDNVTYGAKTAQPGHFISVGISYRGLGQGEHLDFSRYAALNYCSIYVYSAAQFTGIGCWNGPDVTCFELWR